MLKKETLYNDDKPTVAFHTLGCKLNFSETATIARQFEAENYTKVPFESKADVYVINTCSVTENADKRLKGLVQRALKQNPKGYVAAIGCYAQLQPKEIAQLGGVDLVLGAKEKFKLLDYITDLAKKEVGTVDACEIEATNRFESSYSVGERTRAFLKVQDGCDYKCTYCTIPKARGISRSDTLENILINAKEITNQGIKEIVLTGVNIGDYGKGEYGNKKHEHTFFDLIQALENRTDADRIRISSIEPNLLTDEIISFVSRSQKFVPHFHIPLQSGSDILLKSMKRRYLTSLYVGKVKEIRKHMPHASIGVDVIVGYPGETEEEFLKTYDFLTSLPISYLHVFTYSERPGTEAATMENSIPMEVRHKRSKMLRILSVKKRRAFYEKHLSTSQQVLFEGRSKEGYMFGFTPNYIKVKTQWDSAWVNKKVMMKMKQLDPDGVMMGEVECELTKA